MNNQPPIHAPRDRQSENHERQMARYGITEEHKTVYHYKGHVYERLADAMAYAAIDTERNTPSHGDTESAAPALDHND